MDYAINRELDKRARTMLPWRKTQARKGQKLMDSMGCTVEKVGSHKPLGKG